MKINLGVYIFWEPKLKPILILGGTLVPVFDTQLTLGLLLELKTGWNQCWTNIGLFNIPIWYEYLTFLEFCIPWQYGYWGKNMKIHTKWYQYVQSLQFSHNGMRIMILKCVILKGSIVWIWIYWFNVWCHKKLEPFA